MSAATPTGCILFFYAVDVAEVVNLPALNDLLGGTTRATPLVPCSTAPAHLPVRSCRARLGLSVLRHRMSYLEGDLLVPY